MREKTIDVCGIGNALVDVLIEVNDDELAALGLKKGSWDFIDRPTAEALLQRFAGRRQVLASGGSVANSVILAAQLGGRAALCTSVGDDKYGAHFTNECSSLGVSVVSPVSTGEATGVCLCFISPNAERTMRPFLGACNCLSEMHVDEEAIAAARWLFIEGYVFGGGEAGLSAVRAGLRLARAHDCRVAVTLSAVPIVQQRREEFRAALQQADLVFANEEEAAAYTGRADIDGALQALSGEVPHAVVTGGEKGASICCSGSVCRVPAIACTPVDLTGAGDAFAGAYLYGVSQGMPIERAGRLAVKLAKEVICQVGARLAGVPEAAAELAPSPV